MKLKKYLAGVMLSSLLVVPTVTAFASDKGATGSLIVDNSKNGTISVGEVISTRSSGSGNGGLDVFKTHAIGSNMMDADWTLNSSSGPITYLNTTVVFDDGYTVPFTRSCFSGVEQDTAQNTYSEPGYHTASFSGYGTIDFVLSFTCRNLTDGSYVYD